MKRSLLLLLFLLCLTGISTVEGRIRRHTVTQVVSEQEYKEHQKQQESESNTIIVICGVIIGGFLLIKLFSK